MTIRHWAGRLTSTPVLVGAGLFVALGTVGYLVTDDQIVVLPVAFVAGVTGGMLSDSHTTATQNAITGVLLGFAVVMLFFAASRVQERIADESVVFGDVVFFTMVVFLTEVLLSGVFVFILGYAGGYIAERLIRRLREEESTARDFSELG